jgi:RecB family exonuclease
MQTTELNKLRESIAILERKYAATQTGNTTLNQRLDEVNEQLAHAEAALVKLKAQIEVEAKANELLLRLKQKRSNRQSTDNESVGSSSMISLGSWMERLRGSADDIDVTDSNYAEIQAQSQQQMKELVRAPPLFVE